MIKTHRVGTLTLGCMLIVFGVLFVLHIFFSGLSYDIIFRIWPIILIFLGLEILVANFIQKEEKLIYDKTAFALIIVLTFFAMGMAIVDYGLYHATYHLTIH
jgi:hypothetical protein